MNRKKYIYILHEKPKHQRQLPKCYLIDNHDQPSNNQSSWNKITKMLKQAVENTIG